MDATHFTLSFNPGYGDFETPRDVGGDNVYEVTVRATDSNGISVTSNPFTVTVTGTTPTFTATLSVAGSTIIPVASARAITATLTPATSRMRKPTLVGTPVIVAFKLTDAETGKPRTGLKDVDVSYTSPGRPRFSAAVREVGNGVYEATLSMPDAGAYYVYVAVPSANIKVGDLTFLSLIADAQGARPVRRSVK